jgi:hypothetical protein
MTLLTNADLIDHGFDYTPVGKGEYYHRLPSHRGDLGRPE